MKSVTYTVCVILIAIVLLLCGVALICVSTPATAAQYEPARGLAMAYPQYMEDLDRLNVGWWYAWSSNQSTDQRYVPMSWCGEDPNLPLDYSSYVLLFNEPEVETQCNITPAYGLLEYKVLQAKYHHARWVVGNTTFWGGWQYWLNFFYDLCSADQQCIMPEYWGVHVYLSGTPEEWTQYVQAELDHLHERTGGTFWITEFAEVNGNVDTDQVLVTLFRNTAYIDRYAYFTNRSDPQAPWYLEGWRVDLFDWATGDLTTLGAWYNAGVISTFYLPAVLH